MKKTLISSILLLILVVCSVSLTKSKFSSNKTDEVNPKISASYDAISGLDELKGKSDIIVEAESTGKYEFVDYKGVKMRKTTIKVLDVVKGDNKSKELKILQSENVEGEEPLDKGEKVLIFLRKGIDFTDSYVPVGGSQGIYKIEQHNTTTQSLTESKIVSDNKGNNVNKNLQPHSLVNKKILKDLSGNYDDIKKKLAN